MQDARAEANDRAQMSCFSSSTNSLDNHQTQQIQQSQETPEPAKSKAETEKKPSLMPVEQQFGSFS